MLEIELGIFQTECPLAKKDLLKYFAIYGTLPYLIAIGLKRYPAFGEERKALSKRYEYGIYHYTIAVKRCRWLRRGARWR